MKHFLPVPLFKVVFPCYSKYCTSLNYTLKNVFFKNVFTLIIGAFFVFLGEVKGQCTAGQTQIMTDACASATSGWTFTNGTTASAIQASGYWHVEKTADVITSPNYTVNGTITVRFSTGTFGTVGAGPNTLIAEYSTNGSTWTSLNNTANPTSSTYVSSALTISGNLSSSTFQIRFRNTSSTAPGIRLDNIYLCEAAPTTINYFWGGTTINYSGAWTTGTPWGTTTSSGANTAWPASGSFNANFNAATSGIATIPASISIAPNNTILNANTTFNTATATNGALTSTINLNTNTLTNAPVTATTLTLSGVISGTGAITQNGAGTTLLSGLNTYTGVTTITSGTLRLGATGTSPNSPLGTIAASTSVSSGGALDLNGFTLATAEGLTLNGTGISSVGALINSSATAASYSGAVALGSNSSIGTTGNITLSGVVSGAFSLTKVGTGTLTLSGSNTYTGATIVAAGEIRLNPLTNYSNTTGTCNFNGGKVATTGVSAGRTIAFNSLTVSENSTLELATATAHTITFTNVGTLTVGKTLTITGWAGTIGNGSSGTQGKVYIPSLNCTTLARIKFSISSVTYDAALRTDGEIVPANVSTPTISSLSPTAANTGGAAFTLTVNGANFINGLSTITWNGTPLTTTFVSTTQLTVSISAALIASDATIPVGVTTVCSASATTDFVVSTPSFSISTTSATYGAFCNGVNNNVSVFFTSSGAFTGNFFVQLSNASGVFPSNSTSNIISSGSAISPITATIPSGQIAGTGYRVRVVNQSESIQSTNDNGNNIAVNTTPTTSNANTPAAVCQGNTVTITGAGSIGATNYSYWTASSAGTQYITGTPTGYTVASGNLTTPSSLSAGTVNFWVQAENTALCSSLARQQVTITINTLPNDPSNPIAATNPSCGGTSLNTMSSIPVGETYYWQGTTSNGTITNLGDATSTYAVSTTGTYYVRSQNTNGCWSAGRGSLLVTIHTATTSIAPFAAQNILTNTNGTQLTVTESPAAASRKWMYSTTSGSGYIDFSLTQTGTTYTPNFSSANTYYIVCQSTFSNSCGVIMGNEIVVTVNNPGPPVITHIPVSNTNATGTQTAIATITSATSLTSTPFITYRINGGIWATVNGTNPSGNTWNFAIPGQVAGTLIEYFISATNATATTTSPAGVTTSSTYGSFNEYAINCTPASSGTQTIAYQGFEFIGSASYSFAVENTNTAPTGSQNYPAYPSAVEWNYYNKGANGSATATNRNACGCMAETYSGLPAACPDNGNPVFTAGGSTGYCRTFGGNSRGVYVNTSASTENPTGSRSRNGNYSYIQQSRADGGVSPLSFIYFDDVVIPDAANATNIKVIAYISSISTSTLANGAESADFVELNVKYNSTNTVNTMVADPTCGSDLYFFSSSNGSSVAGTTNQRWDYAGNLWNTTPAVTGTTTKNKITLNIPNGTTNVRALIRLLNDDSGNSELWSVDDIQVIADYPITTTTAGRFYRSKQNGKWENISTWESSTTINGTFSPACEVPTFNNSDTIIIRNGHTVRITADQTVDQLRVLTGGNLILTNKILTINNQANSTDFTVDGTYEDNAETPYGIVFSTGAKWKYNTGATIIKTNSSSVVAYKDNYDNGIATIPADASWYYRYNGSGSPSTTAVDMFYPDLFFENTFNTNNFSFNSSAMSLQGGTSGFCTVKGNLNIGTTGTGSVIVFNNNLNSNPMLILGNVTIATNSTLTNEFCNNCGAATTSIGNGTGFEVRGNVAVAGTFDINSASTGLLKFSGNTTPQTISGNGTIDIWDIEVNKTAGSSVLLGRAIDVNDDIILTSGTLNANANTITVFDDWTNTGATYTHGNNLVIFDGNDNCEIRSNNQDFYKVEIATTGSGKAYPVINDMKTVDELRVKTNGNLESPANRTIRAKKCYVETSGNVQIINAGAIRVNE